MTDKKKMFRIIGFVLLVILFVSVTIFSLELFKLNVIPNKYLVIAYSILSLVFLSIFLYVFFGKSSVFKGILLTLVALCSVGFLLAKPYLRETYEFLESLRVEKDGYLTYSVVVLKDSSYQNVRDLMDKSISYLDDYVEEIEQELLIDFEERIAQNFGDLTSSLLDREVEAIVIESASFDIAKSNIEYFEESVRVLHTFEVKISNEILPDDEENKEEEPDILKEPFVLYISGIDQYGNVKSVRGRSDVNQLAIVNPKTNKILLVNTPRDYYVQLHGKTGLRDKLTHAGIYGIDMSMHTLEDLYSIDIDYYLRVNFNTLINVVDQIGGIDIYSDKAFTAYTNGKVHVKKGLNHFDGAAALAYSRERYAYASGDRHRGENQQQVISAIIDKVTSSEVLIKNYNNILNSLSKTFQTNMEVDTITSFLRYQLDKMPKWKVESISVTGTDSRNYTYSMGMKYLLYVMEPNLQSVNSAKEKIIEVMNEN